MQLEFLLATTFLAAASFALPPGSPPRYVLVVNPGNKYEIGAISDPPGSSHTPGSPAHPDTPRSPAYLHSPGSPAYSDPPGSPRSPDNPGNPYYSSSSSSSLYDPDIDDFIVYYYTDTDDNIWYIGNPYTQTYDEWTQIRPRRGEFYPYRRSSD